MRLVCIVCGLAVLAGCAPTPGPIVSMFNGDSVNVQFAPMSDPDRDNTVTRAMANRICEKRGLNARYAATRTLTDHIWEYLYRCR